ncbi:MAG: autotransporter-associated beta strand repeat-containing protein, partial [Kiritimatiellae bacterium]|nr:autotransporter-associated beta strand repeat-containing protein [Kiritimatiellia bacterium]
CQLRVMNVGSTPCVFAGRIVGKGIRWYSGGNVRLTGTNSNFSGSMQIWSGYNDFSRRGVTGLAKIGHANEESSAGIHREMASREHGACFLYLGEGETTSKEYYYYNNQNNDGMHVWDAGAHGGVTFTGKWGHGGSSSTRAERLVLTGSNTAPCVISGEWAGDNSAPTYVIKRGTGTWTFADNSSRRFTGGMAVEEGVLRFASIADTNVVCSLGLATMLQSAYTGAAVSEANANYFNLRTFLLNDQSQFTALDRESASSAALVSNGVLFIDNAANIKYTVTNDVGEEKTLYATDYAAYVANGPKNEIYLASGQGVAFKLANFSALEGKDVRYFLGLSAPKNGSGQLTVNDSATPVDVTSYVDMYYPVTPDANGVIKLVNNGSNMISVTNLKITGATLGDITAQNVASITPTTTQNAELMAAKRMAFAMVTTETVEELADPVPATAPTEEPDPEPTQQPSLHDLIRQLFSDFVSRLFSSIGHLFN